MTKHGGSYAGASTTLAEGSRSSLRGHAQREFDPRQLMPESGHEARPPVETELAAGRFQLLREVGRGGMGAVYEALDTQTGGSVALKVLTRPEATRIRRFKSEFRSLVDLVHPNLVRLRELFAETGHWFFTMDLVHGVHFDRWVRAGGRVDPTRLRSAFLQLTAAVGALHSAGKLHRDLKPSNVLVAPDGRVTVLDFGLVTDWHSAESSQTLDSPLLGTPSHIAPELVAGGRATPASDYYALGVMLYQAFTGALPFTGPVPSLLDAKQRSPAPQLPSEIPAQLQDLSQLCAALLERDPRRRPDPTALSAAGAEAHGTKCVTRAHATRSQSELLGRDREVATLRDAFMSSRGGKTRVVFVSGESGIGKTALCESFLRELRERKGALVIAGRCHELESVPFKMFDSLVDEISRYLRRLDAAEAAAIVPRHAFALARLFPALEGVCAVAQAPQKQVSDPHELQGLAFSALHELLCRLGDRRELVLYIDDLQWTDHDSVVFLSRLLLHRTPVPALIIASHRSEAAGQNRLLAQIREAAAAQSEGLLAVIDLAPLSPTEIEQLARRTLTDTTSGTDAIVSAVVREAGGSPFLAGVLVDVANRGRDVAPSALSLTLALAAEFADLSRSARRVLQLLALAGQPLAATTALAAAAATATDLDALRAAKLARGTARGDLKLVDCYHDRIRACVAELLQPEARCALFADLARVLLQTEQADPHLVFRCLEGSGDRARAARFAELAGDRAADSTAFERAAELYAKALELDRDEGRTAMEVELKLADALARLGRGAEAAAAYLRVAETLPAAQSRDPRRKAAELLLTCGYVAEGETLLRALCKEVGLQLPSSALSAMALLLSSHVRLRVRGVGFRERPPASLSDEENLRLETARSAVQGFAGHRPLLAASMADRFTRLALDSGQLDQIAIGLSFRAYFQTLARFGADEHGRALALLEPAARVASRGSPHARAFIEMTQGMLAVNHGRWREARALLARALTIYTTECDTGSVAWEVECTRLHDLIAANLRGDWREAARDAATLIDDSFGRGRAWGGATAVGIAAIPAWLASDDVVGLRREFANAGRRWIAHAEPGWPDFFLMLGQADCELYCRTSERAPILARQRWAAFERSLLRVPSACLGGSYYRGGCALAAWRAAPRSVASREYLATVRVSMAAIARLRAAPGAPAMLAALKGGMALAHGRDEVAARSFRSASEGFLAADMRMHAAAARYRLGELMGGDRGRALVAEAGDAMRVQGVRNVDAMTGVLCPGSNSP